MPFLKRQMALTAAEFLRLLPRAVAPYVCQVESGRVTISLEQGMVHIDLQQLPARKIASLSLPVLQVEMTAQDADDVELAALLASFDRSFQRGGG